MTPPDPRIYSPSYERNREPIFEVLKKVLPEEGRVLEIAAGTGQHAADFSRRLPRLFWQPTEADAGLIASVRAFREASRAPDVADDRDALLPPLLLDVTRRPWPVRSADVIVCINMIHISPWQSTLSLFVGAAEVLPPGGLIFLYGPYKVNGEHTAPSNSAFDESLRARDAAWGVRDVAEVSAAALDEGLMRTDWIAMPGNNQSLVFRKDGASRDR